MNSDELSQIASILDPSDETQKALQQIKQSEDSTSLKINQKVLEIDSVDSSLSDS